MKRSHFEAFAPVCPVCAGAGRAAPLRIATVAAEAAGDVIQAVLECGACRHEYPVIDGIAVIVPDLARVLGEQALGILLRDDIAGPVMGVIADAVGPATWLDALRQSASIYGWDAYADLDPGEPGGGPHPGAARRCLARLLDHAPLPGALIVDAGCGAGRTAFEVARAVPDALVLGIDVNLGLLRIARGALAGRVRYPRRRVGIVFDERTFGVALPGERVDVWACDAQALPFAPGTLGGVVALNLLDCVPDPAGLLAGIETALRPGGRLLTACPYDWSVAATQPAQWIGGHAQRGDDCGRAEPRLRDLLGGGHARAARNLRITWEDEDFPWATRLHDRACVQYRTHLVGATRDG